MTPSAALAARYASTSQVISVRLRAVVAAAARIFSVETPDSATSMSRASKARSSSVVRQCSDSSASSLGHSRTIHGMCVVRCRMSAVEGLDGTGEPLETRGIGDDPEVRLEAEPQAMLADKRAGERMVGRGGGVSPFHLRRLAETGQAGAYALAELGRGLVGEGQADDAVGRDAIVADQPHDASRHDRRLARAGAGDDGDRLVEAGGDRRHLLLGEVDAQHLAQVLLVAHQWLVGGHARSSVTTDAPASCAGQMRWKAQ